MPNEPGKLDRLSDLHESLIIQILSLLDMKNAVKTCVLSKRWKHLWTQVYVIVFDFSSSFMFNDKELFKKNMNKCISSIDSTLMKCVCSNIERFSLTAELVHAFYGYEFVHNLVDKWIAFVLKLNVKFLNLNLCGLSLGYSVPNILLNSSSLVKLELDRVEIRICSPVKWTLLKTLCLVCLQVEDDSMENILLGCPVLETLILDFIYELHYINIMSRSVKTLKLYNMEYRDIKDDEFLEITAPYIRTLEIGGPFLIPQFKLVDVSSLEMATLNFEYQASSLDNDHISNGCNYNLWWINMVMVLLGGLCEVDTLTVNSQIIQALSVSKLWNKPYPVFKCKCLTIWATPLDYDIYGIPYLLQNAPRLETLCIKATDRKSINIMLFVDALYKREYMHAKLPKGDLMHLKTVKVDFIRDWCENQTFYQFDIDDLISEYILKNAAVIEKLVIFTSAQQCNECLLVCSSKHVNRLCKSLVGTFLENRQYFKWELKTIKSGLGMRMPFEMTGEFIDTRQ